MEKGWNLKEAIGVHFALSDFQVAHSFNEFETILNNTMAYQYNQMAIIMLAGKAQLTRLLEMKGLLKGMRLVMVLPNESKTIRSLALKLYPRFFTSQTNNYDDLRDILMTMITKKKGKYD